MSFKKYRNNNTQSIQAILEQIIDSPALSKGIRETRAVQAWNKVLGPTVANITKQISIRGGVLYVSLYSSVIRNDLMMHKDKIIQSLNAEAGAKVVYDIVIR
jgi:predicted nucleic acid-binding Zn ribbon protein